MLLRIEEDDPREEVDEIDETLAESPVILASPPLGLSLLSDELTP